MILTAGGYAANFRINHRILFSPIITFPRVFAQKLVLGCVAHASVYNPSIERPLSVSVMPVVKVPTAICSSLDRRRATVRYPTSIGCAHDRASVVRRLVPEPSAPDPLQDGGSALPVPGREARGTDGNGDIQRRAEACGREFLRDLGEMPGAVRIVFALAECLERLAADVITDRFGDGVDQRGEGLRPGGRSAQGPGERERLGDQFRREEAGERRQYGGQRMVPRTPSPLGSTKPSRSGWSTAGTGSMQWPPPATGSAGSSCVPSMFDSLGVEVPCPT
jgi:hypothetical protein